MLELVVVQVEKRNQNSNVPTELERSYGRRHWLMEEQMASIPEMDEDSERN